jgi:thiamine biosynthesis lipoprotein
MSMRLPVRITRRSFLSLPATIPLATFPRVGEHHFPFDHVIGTSLDLVVWTSCATAAQRAAAAVVAEIHRLASILDTRDPNSEISQLGEPGAQMRSRELAEVLSAYDDWAERTGGIVSVRPAGAGTARNVDALGKAYILERSAILANASPGIDGVLVNIGGDIVVRGRSCEIAVADGRAPHENGTPLTRIRLHNAAIATSGTYARGAHLLDARTGQPAAVALSGTVTAPDAVTANALATMLCLTDAVEGLQVVERTPGAAALRMGRDRAVARTAGFARLERPSGLRAPAPSDWPPGYELTISLTLTEGTAFRGGRRGGFGGGGGFGGRGRAQRPYVAVWIENTSGKLIRVLAFWANKEKYFSELSSFWNLASRNQNLLYSTARATRDPGHYQFVWDGLDNDRKPVSPGTYRIVVETNQEHGVYAKQAGTIACVSSPAALTLPATANFDAVTIQYGPKPKQA